MNNCPKCGANLRAWLRRHAAAIMGGAGRGQAKARTSAQARAAAKAKWDKYRLDKANYNAK